MSHLLDLAAFLALLGGLGVAVGALAWVGDVLEQVMRRRDS